MQTFYRILFVGDFHYGESYGQAGARVLQQHGYEYATQYLQPFIRFADYTIVNLETPIVGASNRSSPLAGRKRYLHWADEAQTPYHLRKLGVDAAAVANNHIMDQGQDGLRETLHHLSKYGIEAFGAGENRSAANAPLSIRIPNNVGGGLVNVYSSFQYSKHHDHEFLFYAKRDSPGCAPLSSRSRYELLPGDVYNVAFPHWGANYKWKSRRQESLAENLADQGFDVTIGHGSHCVQEIASVAGMPTVYGIGNGVFQSGGRFAKFEATEGILPFGFWTLLEISRVAETRTMRLKLYPVIADNTISDYLPKPVTYAQNRLIYDVVISRSENLKEFVLGSGSDNLGYYIDLDLGEWALPANTLAEPVLAIASSEGDDFLKTLPAQNVFDSIDDLEILRQQQGLRRSIGTLITASEASKDGYSIEWLDRHTALASSKNDSRIIHGHRSSEGFVAAAVVKDKFLTKELLTEAGVKTPRGLLVSSVDEAILAWSDLGCSVVLKPRFGNKGGGVFVNLDSEEAISEHFHRVAEYGPVLLEEYLGTGQEYRCLATPEETISSVMRILPWVEGDGFSTIRELIVEKNKTRFRTASTHDRYIPVDSAVERFLGQRGLSITSILPAGVRVYVRDVGGLSSGGEPYEASGLLGEDITRLASHACSVIPGLTWCGADVLMTADRGPYIIEINTDADISGAVYPWYGKPKSVGSYIWSELKARKGHPVGSADSSRGGLRDPSRDWFSRQSFFNSDNTRMSDYLLDYVRGSGGTVNRVNKVLSKVKLENGDIRWLRGCATEIDPTVPNIVLRSHFRVRKLLGIHGVLRVRGRQVKSLSDIAQISRHESIERIVFPARQQWEPTSAVRVSTVKGEDLGGFSEHRFFMQEYPLGTRLRVAASSTEVFIVFSENQSVEFALLEQGCLAAIEAVRCIPQLRLGFVDVVIRENSRGRRVALVEGISNNPVVRPEDLVIYGNAESLWQFILNDVR